MSIIKCLGTGFGVLTVYYMNPDFIGLGIVMTLAMIAEGAVIHIGYRKEVTRETRKLYREWEEGEKMAEKIEVMQEATT